MVKLKVKKQKENRFKLWFMVLPFTFCLLPCLCYSQPVSSSELINNAEQYDGKTVVYAGEVIGEVMARGKFAWVNLSDGKNSIGIWAERELLKELVYRGGYKVRGDWLEVTGIFHRACLYHGGDLDIHAQALTRISSGRAPAEFMSTSKRNFALALSGILFLVFILTQVILRHKNA
ncbi:MAG: DNA-binding protein [Candidatus Omnitrophica bacterium]|nr:DNA-binding protein [Candidatus Omnitrophota bacterium]